MKKTVGVSERDDVPKFQYVFAHQCDSSFFGLRDQSHSAGTIRSFPAGQTWEETRYLLEKKHGIHSSVRHHAPGRNQERSESMNQRSGHRSGYFEGYMWLPQMVSWRKQKQIVSPTYLIKSGDRLILWRKPLEPGVSSYVPPRYARAQVGPVSVPTVTFTETMTEEEKLQLLVESSAVERTQVDPAPSWRNRKSAPLQFHPADNTFVQPPPPTYICSNCGGSGHWKQFCEVNKPQRSARPVRQPAGIPKSMLVEVSEKEKEKKQSTVLGPQDLSVYLDEQGKYVAWSVKENVSNRFLDVEPIEE